MSIHVRGDGRVLVERSRDVCGFATDWRQADVHNDAVRDGARLPSQAIADMFGLEE